MLATPYAEKKPHEVYVISFPQYWIYTSYVKKLGVWCNGYNRFSRLGQGNDNPILTIPHTPPWHKHLHCRIT